MIHQEVIQLEKGRADGYVVPLGSFHLVWAATRQGMIACGAFDVAALERFRYPAARLKGAGGAAIATIEDLLNGEVREANAFAAEKGIVPGMSGREALEKLSG
jgi:uncharacterized protein YunC (DUF1805 family)